MAFFEFPHTRTYDGDLGWLIKVIKDVQAEIEQIQDELKDIVTIEQIEQVISEKLNTALAGYMLNVKFPPANLKPAVGDGSANDTEAIQGCINYAAENGYGVVYFPYGKYLTSTLELKSNVGLFGFDRYSTSLVCASGAVSPMLSGTVDNVGIVNITLDANAGVQVNDIDVINASASNMLLSNVIFKDGNKHLVINGTGGHLQIDDVVFNDCVVNAITLTGNIDVQATNMLFTAVSDVKGTCVIETSTNGGLYEFKSTATVPTGIILNGNDNVIRAFIVNSTNDVVDNGSRNNIVVYGRSDKKILSGDKSLTAGNVSENVAGDKTVTAGDISETTSGNYTIDVGEDLTEDIKGNWDITVEKDSMEMVTGKKEFISENLILNPSEPLTYKSPVVIDAYRKGVPAKDYQGNIYNLLTDVAFPKLDNTIELYPVTLGLTNPVTATAQGFTMDSEYYYQAFASSNKDNCYIRKISIADNSYVDTTLNIEGNANSLAVDDTYLYLLNSNTKESNKLYKLNKSTFEIISELVPTPWLCGISVDKVTNILYGLSHEPVGVYSIINDIVTLVQSFECKYNDPGQGMGVYDGVAYIPISFPANSYKLDLKTGELSNFYIPNTNGIAPIVEYEDICFDSEGNLYLSSAMYSYNGYYTISTNKAVDWARDENVIIHVAKNNNILPTGNAINPFPDIQTAIWYMLICGNPTIRTIEVENGSYAGFQAYNFQGQIIGKDDVNITTQIAIRSSVIDIENLKTIGLSGTYSIACEDSKVYLNNVTISNLTYIGILADKGSDIYEYNSSYDGVHLGSRYSTVHTKNWDKVLKSTAGPSYIAKGIYLAGKSGTNLSWELQSTFAPNTWTKQPDIYYAINIAGNYYFVNRSGTGTFNVGEQVVTFNGSATEFTLTCDTSITVNYIYAM